MITALVLSLTMTSTAPTWRDAYEEQRQATFTAERVINGLRSDLDKARGEAQTLKNENAFLRAQALSVPPPVVVEKKEPAWEGWPIVVGVVAILGFAGGVALGNAL